MTDTSPTDDKAAAPAVGHGLIPIAALILLFLAAIAVIIEHENPRPSLEPQSQVASVAEAQNAFEKLSLTAKAAIVVDIRNNAILFALNPDAQLPLASLAKVPLAIVVSDVLPPDAVITIPRDTAPRGSPERLAMGEKWRLEDVIDFTLVASSNEGAEILASAAEEAIRAQYPDAPESSATVWRMNSLAEELGLNRTYFLNASGLDISPTLSGAYGSARDMAVLFAYAASERLSVFSKTAGDGLSLTSVNGEGATKAFNTNEARGEIPGLMMGKTGITDLAGGNLAVVFDAGLAHPVVAVVLGGTRGGRFSDMRQLVAKARIAVAEQEKVFANK